MTTDGLYINDVRYVKTFDYEYVKSVGQMNDYFKALISNKAGAGISAASMFDDIKIYKAGTLVFRGRVHDIRPISEEGRGDIVELSGWGYMRDMMDRFVIETFTTKSRSEMVDTIVQNYAPALGTGQITATTGSLTRVIKARSAYEAVLELANEIDYDIWVDNDLDFVFKERNYVASGVSIDYTTGVIIGVNVPQQALSMYNSVRVVGSGTGILAFSENPSSISQYGIRKEYPVIYDKSLVTVSDCKARADSIINNNSLVNPVIEIITTGYETIDPGETVILKNFGTKFSITDGVYLCLERRQHMVTGKTALKLSKYSDSTEDVIIDIIKRMRKIEYDNIDADDVPTKFVMLYEDLELDGYQIVVSSRYIARGFILGHWRKGIIGNPLYEGNPVGVTSSTKAVSTATVT